MTQCLDIQKEMWSEMSCSEKKSNSRKLKGTKLCCNGTVRREPRGYARTHSLLMLASQNVDKKIIGSKNPIVCHGIVMFYK